MRRRCFRTSSGLEAGCTLVIASTCPAPAATCNAHTPSPLTARTSAPCRTNHSIASTLPPLAAQCRAGPACCEAVSPDAALPACVRVQLNAYAVKSQLDLVYITLFNSIKKWFAASYVTQNQCLVLIAVIRILCLARIGTFGGKKYRIYPSYSERLYLVSFEQPLQTGQNSTYQLVFLVGFLHLDPFTLACFQLRFGFDVILCNLGNHNVFMD